MAKIVIKKRISLEYLGQEYKDSYVEFKSLSIKEVEAKLDEIENLGNDNKKGVKLMIALLKDNFISGKFLDEDIDREDLEEFDVVSISKFFGILSGQEGDPKA